MTDSTTLETIDNALLKAGVYALSKKARLSVAEALWHQNVTASDIQNLEEWVMQSEPREGLARRYLAGLLGDAPGASQAIGDLKKHKAMAKTKRDRNSMDWQPSPNDGEDEEKWSYERQCTIVACRINADKADPIHVATELGVSLEQVEAMLKRGTAMQKANPM